ncbi:MULTISPECIES: glycoside hydrolase family 13 protein [unclassified Enterococcus]|uniref:glycoside hydrolase family 13 protein n=1 Tax=unclassified Enterococcus TaxID=2608891 RepID=UPI001555C540|nr:MULTISPECIES: glycoside hydrolase family 13 protein [unclassified Enterococcus]MBS7578354.1 glycoside hydrolase family 13 protein [Enterococcus sp. MMGLQ5-2]MBS7585591.1 glycoside hydrolase family 13 protein [Enterococcus sp. MMGLQ5-1]NPD13450.1 glycoside hydrolase family 13 protein [Enterococcus sp. MMGLQ5-1]NPD38185.1 glycoside hydrolase family 13 protein [Enterococcus sp. MMGLQ5-2]
MQVYFNSWLESYKRPFGAVQIATSICLKIKVECSKFVKVQLVIRQENGTNQLEYFDMNYGENNLFEINYQVSNKQGIYFYYFKIIDQLTNELIGVYGSASGTGGEGISYTSECEVVPFSLTVYSKIETAPSWYRDSIFYQIFPDRFYNGDEDLILNNTKDNIFIYGKTSDSPYYIRDHQDNVTRWDFFGGNLAGIIAKIPYLKNELGVNAIYLNPVFEARSNHRYDTGNYKQIDSLLGDEQAFLRLIDKLHQNDMHLVLDGVFSHVGRESKYFNYNSAYGSDIGAAQNQNSPYFEWFKFNHYPEDYKSWWGIEDLPEVNKHSVSYQNYIYGERDSVLSKWNKFDIDGWRLDVADELPDDFIRGIRANLEQYSDKVLIGEVWEDASRKIAYNQRREYILGDALQATMNYPFRSLILELLTDKIDAKSFALQLTTLEENYPNAVFYNNFNNIGTHDTERILTLLNHDTELLNIAVGLLCTLPGVPCFYYGDEAGLAGGPDPENRKYFPWEKINRSIFKIFQSWIACRKEQTLLRQGHFSIFYLNDGLLGILRAAEDASLIYIVNPTNKLVVVNFQSVCFTKDPPIDLKAIAVLIDGREISPKSGQLFRG